MLKNNPSFLFFALLTLGLGSCKTLNTPEQTARGFLSAVNDKAYAKARKLSTEKTHEMLKMLQSLSQMQTLAGVLGAKTDKAPKFADVQKMNCTENGDIANCTYCCNMVGQNSSVRLVREKGKWRVDMAKENAMGIDLGDAIKQIPDTGKDAPPPVYDQAGNPKVRAEIDSMPTTTADEVAKRFVKGLGAKDYFEIQNLSTEALHNRIAQSMVAEQVLRDSTKRVENPLENYTFASHSPNNETGKDSCVFKAKGKPNVSIALVKDYDGEWRVTNVQPANLIPKPDQTKPESVAAYFITYLLNGSWDDAEAISTPETARTITFLTRTAMNRPESFDNLAKLQCMINAERASCSYCCNPLNNEDTVILIKKDGKWWVDLKLK
jgi:hypothetical protein